MRARFVVVRVCVCVCTRKLQYGERRRAAPRVLLIAKQTQLYPAAGVYDF